MAMEHEMHHGDEHPSSTIRQYVMTGILLTAITVVELFLSYSSLLPHGLMVTLLIGLSAVKFAIVVAIFMHLKFENRLLTRLFLFGIVLATFIMIALLSLFWNDRTDAVGGIPEGQQTAPKH